MSVKSGLNIRNLTLNTPAQRNSGPTHLLPFCKSDGCCIIVEMARRLSAFIALYLLALSTQICWGQTAEIGWTVTDPKFANAQYVQTDIDGNIYVFKQTPLTGNAQASTLDIYNIYGSLIRSTDLRGLSVGGMSVASETGTVVFDLASGYSVVDWNGYETGADLQVPPLATALDYYGNLIYVYTVVASNETVVVAQLGFGRGYTWTAPFVATGAQIDSQGNVLLLGSTGNFESGTAFANFYNSEGASLWTRSFSTSIAGRNSIVGFESDYGMTQYLVINHSTTITNQNCYVIAIDPKDGSTNSWQSPNIPGSATSTGLVDEQVVIAGQSTQPFVAAVADTMSAQTPGTVLWNVTQANDSLTVSGNSPVVSHYDSGTKLLQITALDVSTGSATSTVSVLLPDSTDVGAISPGYRGVEFVGSTGGTSATARLVHVVYGPNLQSLVLPASIPGGSKLALQLNLTESPSPEFENVALTSSAPSIVHSVAQVQPFLVTQSYQLSTFPVDSDTDVTITGSQYESGAVRSATVRVTTATLGPVSCGTTSFNPSQTATGTVTLSGPTGSSGKTVSLVSSDPSITVPATVKVLAGQTTATFVISSHPVSEVTNPTVTASLAGQSSTLTMQVAPAPLKSLSVTPSSVTAGATALGEVIIGTQAGNSGDVVGIKSNTASVTVPATATIPASGTYTTFAIKTGGVTASTVVTVSAIFNGVTKFASFTVEPAALSGIVISPASVKGGTNAGATVHLNGEAGPSGCTVALKSSNIAVTVPASLTLPVGTSSFSFVLKTNTVKFSTPVTVTATLGTLTKTASLTLTP